MGRNAPFIFLYLEVLALLYLLTAERKVHKVLILRCLSDTPERPQLWRDPRPQKTNKSTRGASRNMDNEPLPLFAGG